MSTNKTQNYNLHSWLPQDEFHVSEINENFTALDAALHQEVGVLDALLQAETAARTQQMAGKADAAQLAAAQTALGQKAQVISGQYEGTGNAPMTIELGVAPRAVFVCASGGAIADLSNAYAGIGAPGLNGPIVCTGSGFRLVSFSASRMYHVRTFFYIALY